MQYIRRSAVKPVTRNSVTTQGRVIAQRAGTARCTCLPTCKDVQQLGLERAGKGCAPGRGTCPDGPAAAALWPGTEQREELEGDGTDDEVGVPAKDGGTGSPMATWILRSCSCTASSVQGLFLPQGGCVGPPSDLGSCCQQCAFMLPIENRW